MPRYPFRRFGFGALRRLLYLWVRSETINQSAFTLKIDRSKPVLYVLQQPSVSDLAVVDTECRKAGLPRPVMPVAVGDAIEPAAFFYLTPEPDWLGRQDKRGASPTLVRMLAAVGQNGLDDAQIIPVSVFWGQSPDSESSPWKLLFADTLSIPLGAQGDTRVALPARGESREAVLQRFGLADEEHPAVGQPPIVRWDYRDFSVYFESGRVIDSVRHHRPRNPVQPSNKEPQ